MQHDHVLGLILFLLVSPGAGTFLRGTMLPIRRLLMPLLGRGLDFFGRGHDLLKFIRVHFNYHLVHYCEPLSKLVILRQIRSAFCVFANIVGQILQLVEHVDPYALILPRHFKNPHIKAGEVRRWYRHRRSLLYEPASRVNHRVLVRELHL